MLQRRHRAVRQLELETSSVLARLPEPIALHQLRLKLLTAKQRVKTMESREQRLIRINDELQKRNLKTFRKLGDQTKGEFEINDIKEIYEHSKRFFTDVKFDVALPGGKSGEFTVRFNANGSVSDGAVIVAIVNGRFAIVKQWRLPLQRWTYEIPRGFGDKADKAQIQGELGTLKMSDLPLGTLERELGEEVMKDATISTVTHLGNIAENSGTHNVAPSYFLVQIQVPEENLAKRLKGTEPEMKVELWDSAKVRSELGGKLCDSHSITAVALAMRYIETLPRA
jgi:hypothetical protein